MTTLPFAELVAATNFSFLRGASHPADMVGRALELGMAGIGIADRNTVAGVVRAWVALRDGPQRAMDEAIADRERRGRPSLLTPEERQLFETDLKLVVGARLVFADGTPDIVAYPANRGGWGRLTRLLTVGNLRAVKGDCILRFDDLAGHAEDLLLIVLPVSTGGGEEAHRQPVPYARADAGLRLAEETPQSLAATLDRLAALTPDRVWLGLTMPRRGDDARRAVRLAELARNFGVPLLATNDALYAGAEQRPLHDLLTCVREGTTIHAAGRRLEMNGERHLKSPAEMARLFAAWPDAVAETIRLLDRIDFRLDELRYEYPHEPVPHGWDADSWLAHLAWQAAHKRHGPELPDRLVRLVEEELELIRARRYAPYFLTVHDMVRFARTQQPPILCQGRGSAANSAVCFLLGITSVDPMKHDLLFSRFISEERNEPPDIDVDFEHERREEVMQYIYRRYGRHRAGIAATVIHYRSRSTVREVAKALGMTEDVSARIASTVWGSWSGDLGNERISEAGFDLANPEIVRLRAFCGQLLRNPFPRHLSQHVGGYVLTQDRLDETVPIHNGAMADRTFIEWDKDDIDALGLMKVDVLALGMLTCIRKSFDLMRAHGLGDHTLEVDIDADDPAVFDMLCKGDSIGVFQVESRAQINMLPRLRPRNLYDLTVQVAIVRPGPIEGDMVHPYLRRRAGIDPVEYPSPAPPHDPDELKKLLGGTFGVPLFQEQAMKLAIVAAEFTPNEANRLRRAMATFRHAGGMDAFRDKLINGMTARGYDRDFAERCYRQIEGFGSYGFPESHALSFARLVYVSSWIKCHHPAVFAAALLNSQPMGFYAPAQLVRDAAEHGVEVRDVDINASSWDCTLEPCAQGGHALRLGFRLIDGFRATWAAAITQARARGNFASLEDLARRAALGRPAIRALASADACRSIGLDRRAALWDARRMPEGQLPLFAAADAEELASEPDAHLPPMPTSEQVVADYQTLRLSLKGHPMSFLRDMFADEGVLSCAETSAAKNGQRVRTAGVVLVRQRPGGGNAIFMTIEDESGVTNILLWARDFERQRREVMGARLMVVDGVVQRSKEGIVHLMARRITDRTAELDRLSRAHRATIQLSRADEFERPQHPRGKSAQSHHGQHQPHPRNVRILPKSRDFH
ncbi:error-prone DNA polymerase [Sphingomonas xanthus]|uniref:Error-prone DNA polymerase n=1 Tax=Sphingomonas xanthus TaxID=2594473 RepID=A0A516IS55_9SPHN|nr:error-prone DNA polymerase [Sphingomonas xanthus]QDP19710.1 DNA polymerase III subunit alpha [Sphingomonas xanthus]